MLSRNLSFSYPGGSPLFDNFSIDLPEGAVSAILGPSGCGKTTFLHLVAGLLQPSAGTAGRTEGTAVSYLFQEPRLLPWLTVRENIALVNDDSQTVESLLEMVELAGMADIRPDRLSGGMRQRVAMARAFAFDASLLLMDEPFQALDLALRISLVNSFRQLWSEAPKTTVFVSHDVQEAIILGDTISVLSEPPVKIAGYFNNPVARGDRRLDNPELLELEARLYRLLLDRAVPTGDK
jgi:NitT/TauT family transport system ATP-binding protein